MIDLNKKYRTRCGFEVRLYALYPNQLWVVHGTYKRDDDLWINCAWLKNGKWVINDSDNPFDLVEIKPERWYPIYKYPHCVDVYFGSPQPSREEAMNSKSTLGVPIDAWKAPE